MKLFRLSTLFIYVIILNFFIVSNAYCQPNEDEEPVKVTYRKNCMFFEPQYNLPGLRQYLVHKDKVYADGTIVTETSGSMRWLANEGFGDYGWRGDVYSAEAGDHFIDDGSVIKYSPSIDDYDDFYGRQSTEYLQLFLVSYHSIGVPDLSKLSIEDSEFKDNWVEMHDLRKYSLNYDRVNYLNPDSLQEALEGWYYNIDSRANYIKNISYLDYRNGLDHFLLRHYSFGFQQIGYILWADGQLFDFYEFKPTSDVDFRIKDATMPNGQPAKIITYECRRKYSVGPDKYWAIVDTIYQLTPEEARQWSPKPSTISLQVGCEKLVNEPPFSASMIEADGQNVIWRKEE